MESLPIDEERFLADIAAYLESDDPLPALAASLERDLNSILALDCTLTAGDSIPSATNLLKPKRCRAKRSRNLARERMQGELRELRVESAELERQVEVLKKQRTLSTGDQLLLASWKRIAAHQRDERHDAERENMHLKQKLQNQMALACELRRTALSIAASGGSGGGENPGCGMFDGYLLITSQIPRQTCTDAQDLAVFRAMSKEADLLHTQMDAVLQRSGLREWHQATVVQPSLEQADTAKRRTIASLDGSIAIELASGKVYASAIDIVFRVMWETWEKEYMWSSCVLFDLGDEHPSNTIVAMLDYHIDVNGDKVLLHSKAVLKVYPNPKGGLRFVWRTISSANSRFPGVCVDEICWDELAPTADGGSVMLSCSHLRSKTVAESNSSSDSNKGVETRIAADTQDEVSLANLLAASYEAEVEEMNLRIAGLLLDDGIKS